tara:strand:- start:6183 stop:8378 length:2196 start_codon:yes stop_codon:yes gene_type:complete
MAEIKVYNPQSVFNKPIGVVTPSTAGVQSAQATAQLFGNLTNLFYDRAVESEEKKGTQFAENVRTLDKDQNVTIQKVPNSFSKIATETAEPLLRKRFTIAIGESLKRKAQSIRRSGIEDPEEFKKLMGNYIDQQAKLNPEYLGVIQDLGGSLQEDNYNDLFIKELNKQEDRDFNFEITNLDNNIGELSADIIAANEANIATIIAGQTTIEENIYAIAEEYPEKIPSTFVITQLSKLELEVNSALVDRFVSRGNNVLQELSPARFAEQKLSLLNYMNLALRNGSVSQTPIPENIKSTLAKIGFNDSFVDRNNISRTNADAIASKLAVDQGTLSEELSANSSKILFQEQTNYMKAGGSLNAGDAKDYLEHVNIQSSFDITSNMALHFPFNPDTNNLSLTDSAVGLLIRSNSQLPSQISNVFTPEGIADIAVNSPEYLNIALDIYNQATRTFIRDDTGNLVQITQSRGLSQKNHTFMRTLDAYKGSIKPETLPQFLESLTKFENMTAVEKSDRLKSALNVPENARATYEYENFLKKALDNDASAEEREYFRLFADELLIIHGRDKAEEILKANKKLFVNSKYMAGRSRFAPERNFLSDELQTLDKEINSVLNKINIEDKKIGEDVFLVADEAMGDIFPRYFLTDKNGRALLYEDGQYAMISTDVILKERMREKNQKQLELIEEAKKARDLYMAGPQAILEEAQERKDMEIIIPSATKALTPAQQEMFEKRQSEY